MSSKAVKVPHKFTPFDFEPNWQTYWETHHTYRTPDLSSQTDLDGLDKRRLIADKRRYSASAEQAIRVNPPESQGLVAGSPDESSNMDSTSQISENQKRNKNSVNKQGQPSESSSVRKAYVLDMFPYPSAQGLHVGHPEGYTATDIYSRYLRMNGHAVLHPMGWDAFGLPAENYAIKLGIHPEQTTRESIATFKRQIKMLGFSYDWQRELATCDPAYYRWTQWLFSFLYKRGLAEKKKAPANWCPSCQTVLANEQVVEGGKCERCGSAVIQKDIKQWFFKITAFAEELLADLAKLDWPKSTKLGQINWIGKSEGLIIKFKLSDKDTGTKITSGDKVKHDNYETKSIEVFTTRPDTIFGATFIVLAPEHSQVPMTTQQAMKAQIIKYQEEAKHKTELQRIGIGKEKSGVWTGSYALNPFTKAKMPIYVSDYVVTTYGTGAIMGVPAHDSRDYQFAKNLGLEIKAVCLPIEAYNKLSKEETSQNPREKYLKMRELIPAKQKNNFPQSAEQTSNPIPPKLSSPPEISPLFPFEDYGVTINSGKYTGLASKQCIQTISKDIENMGIGHSCIKYKLRDWLISRQRYWGAPIPIIYCEKCGENLVPDTDLPVLLPKDVDFKPTGESPLSRSREFHNVKCPKCGGPAKHESDTMDTFVCSSWYFFAFTFWEKYKQTPYSQVQLSRSNIGNPHAMTAEQIQTESNDIKVNPCPAKPEERSRAPVSQPDIRVNSIRVNPSESQPDIRVNQSESQSSVSDNIQKSSDPVNTSQIRVNPPENNSGNIYQLYAKEIRSWLPVDLYVGGAEHTVLHLLYARFITKALHQAGLSPVNEPFARLRHQGMILGMDGQKMSKSRGNVINPDEIVRRFGADTMRMYEMFMGPLDAKKAWNTHGVEGVFRFLSRVWHLYDDYLKNNPERVSPIETTSSSNDNLHQSAIRLAAVVEHDILKFKFNTAIAKMMTWLNETIPVLSSRLSVIGNKSTSSQSISFIADEPKTDELRSLQIFLLVLAPFAPHTCEELWWRMQGRPDLKSYHSIHLEPWPVSHPEAQAEGSQQGEVFLVEINGRVVEKIMTGSTQRSTPTNIFSVGADLRVRPTQSQVEQYCLSLPRVQSRLARRSPCLAESRRVGEGGPASPSLGGPPAPRPIKKTIYIPGKLINFVAT